MRRLSFFMVGFLVLVSTVSCTKDPGIGGRSSVSGKIYMKKRNSLGTIVGEYYAQNYNVYLIYGDANNTVNDGVKTSYDGSFEFKYLNKGKYKLFVYSTYSANCTVCQAGQDSVVNVPFEITAQKQAVNLTDIVVYK